MRLWRKPGASGSRNRRLFDAVRELEALLAHAVVDQGHQLAGGRQVALAASPRRSWVQPRLSR